MPSATLSRKPLRLQPPGNRARPLNTLAALLSGIVGRKSTPLPHIAAQVPHGTKPASRVQRCARWFDNDHLREEGYFLPYETVRELTCTAYGSPVRDTVPANGVCFPLKLGLFRRKTVSSLEIVVLNKTLLDTSSTLLSA